MYYTQLEGLELVTINVMEAASDSPDLFFATSATLPWVRRRWNQQQGESALSQRREMVAGCVVCRVKL